MPFTILSWNICHLRTSKIMRSDEETNNLRMFYEVLQQADIAFLYECKRKDTADELLEILNQPKKLAKEMELKLPEVTTYKWDGGAFGVGLGEVVLCFWKETSVASVENLSGIAARFRDDLLLGERFPACVCIETISGFTFCVGAWHPAGPAVTQAKSVKGKFLNIAGLDLLFGDFNFEAPKDDEPMNPIPALMPDATSVFGLPKKVKGAPVMELEAYAKMDTAKDEKLPTHVAMDTAKDEKLPTKSFEMFEMIAKNPDILGKRQTALLEEVHAVGKQGPSTYTENGPVKNRKSPLDRVFASHQLKNSVMVVQYTVKDAQKAKALTDHVPISITILIDD